MSAEYIWYNDLTKQFLEKDYLLPSQTLDERVNVIVNRASQLLGDPSFGPRFKANLKKGWYSLSTPIWSNYGTSRGLPISCFSSYIEDNMASILHTHAEIGMCSKYGGGTSAYFGELRGRGATINNNGQSSGAVHFMELFDKLINVCSQGSVRRGQCAAYLPVDHADILEFLDIRSEGHPIQDLNTGVCVPEGWMDSMIAGDKTKQRVWAKVLQSRVNTGYPYIFFADNANAQAPEVYKAENKRIHASQLCSEIALSTDAEESFVCCLSSMNIYHFDEWRQTDAVELLVRFLDTVLTEFIDKARNIPFMEKTVRFAENQRAIGVGWLGWHSYLQSKMLPWESFEAKMLNVEVAQTIHKQALEASQRLAKEFGEPPLLQGYGRRHVTTQAIAPTKSSAFILGQVSEGIEPIRANITIKSLAKGKFQIKNKALEALLKSRGQNTREIWDSISKRAGSVQHLEILTDHEKAVFKTFQEISPKEIVIQAAARQKYIDQSQSLNLIIHPSTSVKDINALMIFGWQQGIKSYYYQIGVNAAQEAARDILSCESCSA